MKETEILELLKKELSIDIVQVVIQPTDKQIKDAIKELMKIDGMRNMFKRIIELDYQNKEEEEKAEYMRKLGFIMGCKGCNNHTTHKFVEVGNYDKYRLKCSSCGDFSYFVTRKDFDEFYVKGDISLSEINFRIIE